MSSCSNYCCANVWTRIRLIIIENEYAERSLFVLEMCTFCRKSAVQFAFFLHFFLIHLFTRFDAAPTKDLVKWERFLKCVQMKSRWHFRACIVAALAFTWATFTRNWWQWIVKLENVRCRRAMTYEHYKVPQFWWHMHEISADGAHLFQRKLDKMEMSLEKTHCVIQSNPCFDSLFLVSDGMSNFAFFLSWKDVIVCAYMFYSDQNVWRTYTPPENGSSLLFYY